MDNYSNFVPIARQSTPSPLALQLLRLTRPIQDLASFTP
jgi:hypothetical protein